jgi:uncharacterized protein YigE (DUF2233 family)
MSEALRLAATGWRLLRGLLLSTSLVAALAYPPAAAAKDGCYRTSFEGAAYSVCAYGLPGTDIRVFHADAAGRVYGDFAPLAAGLQADGKRLAFAMNAGMYQVDRSPVGLCVTAGRERHRLNQTNAKGNFYLKPNGVFYIDGSGAHIKETGAYAKLKARPREATQSGPLLVAHGRLHPRFTADSRSRLPRNGVGLSADRKQVFFVMADSFVNLYEFARFFRDHLKTPDALYMDGAISRLYAPELKRDDWGPRMGPIIGVVE